MGLCGHKTLPIGEAIYANRVSSEASRERFYPQPPVKPAWTGCALRSLAAPSADYIDGLAFDQEAFAFCTAALYTATLERVHCIKVVSDNAAQPAAERLEKAAVSRLIERHVAEINRFAENVLATMPNEGPSEDARAFQANALSALRFTESERQQLSNRVRKLDALLDNGAFLELNALSDASATGGSLLKSLQERIDAASSQKAIQDSHV